MLLRGALRPFMVGNVMSARSTRLAPPVSALTEQEAFDLKCIRMQHEHLAEYGCGAKDCPVETCAYARQSRLYLKAIAALDASLPRSSAVVPKGM